MRVGWLRHIPPYVGGAELTQEEFKAAAPDGVEITEMPPGEVKDADLYIAHNIPLHTLEDIRQTRVAPLWKYAHDQMPWHKEGVLEYLLDNASFIFCSELHERKFPHTIRDWCVTKVIPPALDLASFKPPRQSRRHRKGACSIAQWRNPGKGAHAIDEWARENGPIDIYGGGDFYPRGENTNYKGPLSPDKMAQKMWEYETFVFLPFDLEPFGRTVAEADAAGCRVVTNRMVGALEYINKPEALQSAAEDFWEVVLHD